MHFADLSKKDFDLSIGAISNFLAFNFVKDGGLYLFNTSLASKVGVSGQAVKASSDAYLTQLSYLLNTLGFKSISITSPIFDASSKTADVYSDIILEEILKGRSPEIIISGAIEKLDWDKQIRFDYEDQIETSPEVKQEAQEGTKEQEETKEEEEILEEAELVEEKEGEPVQEPKSPKEEQAEPQEIKEENSEENIVKEEYPLNQEALFEEKVQETSDKEPVEQNESKTNNNYFFTGEVKEHTENNILSEKTFTADQPFLQDYSIEKVPFLAGSFGLESFAELAKIFNNETPIGFERVHFYLPVKLLRQNPMTVRIKAGKEADKINFEIESDFINSKGIKMGNTRCHITAENLRNFESSWDKIKHNIVIPENIAVTKEDTYKGYFHGPATQVLGGILKVDNSAVLALYKEPEMPLITNADCQLLSAPLLTEAMFQACGYRDYAVEGYATLPEYISKIRFYNQDKKAPKELYVYAKYNDKTIEGKSSFDAFIFDKNLDLWAEVKDLQTIGGLGH